VARVHPRRTGTKARRLRCDPGNVPLGRWSLLATLAESAGEAWTPELERAWTDAYGAITQLMLADPDELSLHRAS
jgi:hemoglobin-like flavoprotein